jgi:soluble lytic murein transglycosylase-like protein
MSAEAIAPGALAASERIQRLRQLAAELRGGPSGFAAALAQASATTSAAQAAAGAQSASGVGVPGAVVPQQSFASYAATPAGSGAGSQQGAQYAPLIEAAAARNGVDPAVLHGLIQQESDFDPSSTSSAGAEGLTQLMPSTASSLGVSDPLDPAQSIEGGARYLGEMLRRFGGNVEAALAAYNAGPGAVQQYGGVPPYAETQQYVSKVLGYAAEYRGSATASSGQTGGQTGAGYTQAAEPVA